MVVNKNFKKAPSAQKTKLLLIRADFYSLMQKRVVFQTDSDRVLFFNEVLKASGFKFWKELRNNANIPKSRLEYYKNGTSTIPFYRYKQLKNFLPKEKQINFSNKIKLLDKNWGQRKGGIITYQKHKEMFEKGRELAQMRRSKNPKFDLGLTLPLNEKLCEFIGAFIGDGFTNNYYNHYLIQFTGDLKLDYSYYKDTIIPIAKSIFNSNPYIQKIENTLRVNFYSKTLYKFLTQRLNFPIGKKSYTVKIPQEILESYHEFIPALLRGLYNTDGCVFFDKRKVYHRPYPRVHIKLINKPLIKQVYDLLHSFDLNPTITKNGYIIQINGEIYVKRFLEKIGFSNQRHLNRIKNSRPRLLE